MAVDDVNSLLDRTIGRFIVAMISRGLGDNSSPSCFSVPRDFPFFVVGAVRFFLVRQRRRLAIDTVGTCRQMLIASRSVTHWLTHTDSGAGTAAQEPIG
jgi:hypothetical protein